MAIKKLDKLGQEIFEQRYAYPGDKTWGDRIHTVAKYIASVEKDEDKEKVEKKFFDVIGSGDFVPGGRILFGCGRQKAGLLNCFFLSCSDDVPSIGKLLNDVYRISCGGGGIGINFSNIRPLGDDISNIKNSAPGAVSVIKLIDSIGSHVKSGKSRRTALLGLLNITHPDILEFLRVKLDLKELTNFNISVGITDRFIEAVEKNESWFFTFNNRKYYVYEMDRVSNNKREKIQVVALNEEDAINRANQHYKTFYLDTFENVVQVDIKAKDLWDLIWRNSVLTGDPGILNVSLINTFTNVSYFEELEGTNPCVVEGTLVATERGYVKVENIKVGDNILCRDGNFRAIDHIEKNHNTFLVETLFSDGSRLVVTPNHQFYTKREGSYVPVCVKDMEVGDSVQVGVGNLKLNNSLLGKPPFITNKDFGILTAIVQSCGWVFPETQDVVFCIPTHKKETVEVVKKIVSQYNFGMEVWESTIQDIPEKFRRTIQFRGKGKKTLLVLRPNSELFRIIKDSEEFQYLINERHLPLSWLNSNQEFLSGFISGLFAYRSTIYPAKIRNSVRLEVDNIELAIDVKRILGFQGIHAKVFRLPPVQKRYATSRFDIWVNGLDIRKLAVFVDVLIKSKKILLTDLVKSTILKPCALETKLISKKDIGIGVTYDLHEPVTDSWVCEGIVSRGCGEIPLPNYGNCCLGSINLAQMVENGEVDWKKLANTTRTAVRFLDNVLSINKYPNEECKAVAQKSRRIGLGVMGYHYMLIKMGLKYGSEKSLQFTERLFETIRNEAYIASVYLAREKGAFPEFRSKMYLSETFSKTLPARVRMLIKEYGIRNAVILTVPPTGSTSMVMGVSSGIEPIFAPLFLRRYRENNVWKEAVVIDPLLKEYLEGGKNIENFVGACDITPEEHVKVQATIQQFIDSSISKTINVPFDVNIEDLTNHIFSYISYLKGITVYRGGSRENEPLSALPLTEENIKKYCGNLTESTIMNGDKCSLNGGNCNE